jgi:bifunctional DNA-binding transcriptional regulator/antitoxin component of YhaV-PrlF toxin-antitoxin module
MAETVELVKMSSKGQLVVPESIREEEGFQPGDRFVPLPIKEGVLFKRVQIPDVRAEFHTLAREVKAQFRRGNVKPKDVEEAIRWARKGSS